MHQYEPQHFSKQTFAKTAGDWTEHNSSPTPRTRVADWILPLNVEGTSIVGARIRASSIVAYRVPRDAVKNIAAIPESGQLCVYIRVGKKRLPGLYYGRTIDDIRRANEQKRRSDFDQLILFYSRDKEELNGLVQKAVEAGMIEQGKPCENKIRGSRETYLSPDALQRYLDHIGELARHLIGIDPFPNKRSQLHNRHAFHRHFFKLQKRRELGVEASGYEERGNGKAIISKGSTMRLDFNRTMKERGDYPSFVAERNLWKTKGWIEKVNGVWFVKEDLILSSWSRAACHVCGGSCSGSEYWKSITDERSTPNDIWGRPKRKSKRIAR